MRKIIFIAILLAGTVFAAVDDKFGTLITDSEQRQKVITARAKLQTIYWDIQRTDAELKEIATSGSFNTVDIEIKKALLSGWNIIKDANDAISNDPNLMKLLDWKPAQK